MFFSVSVIHIKMIQSSYVYYLYLGLCHSHTHTLSFALYIYIYFFYLCCFPIILSKRFLFFKFFFFFCLGRSPCFRQVFFFFAVKKIFSIRLACDCSCNFVSLDSRRKDRFLRKALNTSVNDDDFGRSASTFLCLPIDLLWFYYKVVLDTSRQLA